MTATTAATAVMFGRAIARARVQPAPAPTLPLLTAADPAAEYRIRTGLREVTAHPAAVHSHARTVASETGWAEVRRQFRGGWRTVASYTSAPKAQETR